MALKDKPATQRISGDDRGDFLFSISRLLMGQSWLAEPCDSG
jgi:hypothetical protein